MELICLLGNGVVALNTLKGLRQVGEVNLDPNLTGVVPPCTLGREGRGGTERVRVSRGTESRRVRVSAGKGRDGRGKQGEGGDKDGLPF